MLKNKPFRWKFCEKFSFLTFPRKQGGLEGPLAPPRPGERFICGGLSLTGLSLTSLRSRVALLGQWWWGI